MPLLRRRAAGGEDGSWVPKPQHPVPPDSRHRPRHPARRDPAGLDAGRVLVQAVLILLPGRGKVGFARIYWAGMCCLLGLQRARDRPARAPTGPGTRPVVFVSNHSSWLDIGVLGGRLDACFISKEEVGTLAGDQHDRQARPHRVRPPPARHDRARARRHARAPRRRRQPDPVPGRHHVGRLARAAVPLRVLLDRRAAGDAGRAAAAGAAGLASSTTGSATCRPGAPAGRCSPGMATWTSARISGGSPSIAACAPRVLLHAPLDPRDYPNRKALAQAVWTAVADGAATLRQNRPYPGHGRRRRLDERRRTKPLRRQRLLDTPTTISARLAY